MGIEVATFRLQCATARRERTRFALEDALRTELPDDGRLVLLRRLSVGAPGSSAQAGRRQAAMREAWAAATGGARHGGEDGAEGANCVWFASRDEAERLLLARLLAGRTAHAWFWKLALPGWRGAPVAVWLAEVLAEAIARHDDRRVLMLVETCVAQGAINRLMAALAVDAPAATAAFAAPWPHLAETALQPPPKVGETPSNEAAPHLAATPVAALPAVLREFVVRLERSGTRARPAVTALLRAFALRRSPALALSPVLLERTVAETRERIVSPPPPPRPREGGNLEPPAATPRETARGPRLRGDAYALVEEESAEAPAASSASHETVAKSPEASETPPGPVAFDPIHSHHAGLWLVVPSLAAMGLGEWLADRPELLGAHPARQLLLAVARHHRVALDDPALAVLAPRPDEDLPEWTALWRHGLDRWLRRRARRRLHDLVHRPGRVSWGDLKLDLRFPAADADIRLRLLALDRDPGWTPWLGLSVRYHFSEDRR